MASICAIIGSDFERNPKFDFIVNKILSNKRSIYLSDIRDYLRFEVMKKDLDISGVHYNSWSLHYAQTGMPPFSRKVPDFNTEWKEDNEQENVWSIYNKKVRGMSEL